MRFFRLEVDGHSLRVAGDPSDIEHVPDLHHLHHVHSNHGQSRISGQPRFTHRIQSCIDDACNHEVSVHILVTTNNNEHVYFANSIEFRNPNCLLKKAKICFNA